MDVVAGTASPCNFVHQDKELYVSVHGDDFTIVGPAKELEWMQGLARAYEIKAGFLGPAEEGNQSELSILNRIVRWTAQGLEHKTNQRQAEVIIQHAGVANCKPLQRHAAQTWSTTR